MLPSQVILGKPQEEDKGEPTISQYKKKNMAQEIQGRHLDQKSDKYQVRWPRETPIRELDKQQSRQLRETPSEGAHLENWGNPICRSQPEDSEGECYMIHTANDWPPHKRTTANHNCTPRERKTLASNLSLKVWGIYMEERKKV